MSAKQASVRYAQTLLVFAEEKNLEGKVREDAGMLLESLEHKGLWESIKSPILGNSKKKDILKAVFGGKIQEVSLNFLGLMVDKGRDGLIKEALHSYTDLYNKAKKIKHIKLSTATELSDEDFGKLTDRIKKKYFEDSTLEIQRVVDADLIGGFILEFDDKLLDASLRNSLKKLATKYSN